MAAIRAGRDAYYRAFDAVLTASGDRTARYFSELEPRFNEVREACDRLLQLNQSAMRRKADAASRIARRWFYLTLVLAAGLMIFGIAVQIRLSQAILDPVRQLTEATTSVAAGDLETRVPVRSNDEIGALAGGFNRMAARIRELRQADFLKVSDLKTEFIASASRELRAPLTNVQLGLHAVLEGSAGPIGDTAQEILQDCRDETARLGQLVREMLDLPGLDAGAARPTPAPVRLSILLGEAAELLGLQAGARGAALTFDVPPDLPKVNVDRRQITRVVVELVTNALAATPAGGAITIAAARRGDEAVISVADTGTGIAPADLSRIFEPFSRASAAPGGTGLGLAIARRIVEAHGGRLTAESLVGQGSRFTLTLPL